MVPPKTNFEGRILKIPGSRSDTTRFSWSDISKITCVKERRLAKAEQLRVLLNFRVAQKLEFSNYILITVFSIESLNNVKYNTAWFEICLNWVGTGY